MFILHIGLAPVATTKRSNYFFQLSPPPFVSSPSPAPVHRLSRLPSACASDTIRCTVTWGVSTFGRNFWRGTSLRFSESSSGRNFLQKSGELFIGRIHANPGIHWFIKKTAEEKKNRRIDKNGGLGNLPFLVGIIFRSYVRFRRNNLLKKYDFLLVLSVVGTGGSCESLHLPDSARLQKIPCFKTK